MDVRVEPWRRLSAKELVLLNCGIEKTLETPLDCKKIKIPVNPKGNQPWIFTARTDAEATILWPPDAKSWLFGKNPNAGKEKAGEVDDKGWNGWMASLTQWTWVWASSGDSEGPGSLACCSPWGCEQSDMTERLNNNNLPGLLDVDCGLNHQ